MDVAKKTILITGGLSGIGRAVAKEAAKSQCHLVLVQRRNDPKFDHELQQLGAASSQQMSLDLSLSNAIDTLEKNLKDQDLKVDILFNNAGLLTGGLLEEQNPDKIQKMLAVNLTAPILLTRKLLPGMLERKGGKIINNCSVTAKIAIPAATTYGASKAGLLHFTNCLRQELKKTGVSTLALLTPGVKTDMFDDIKQQYGKNMDTGFLSHISAEQWAKTIWKAVQSDKAVLWPSGPEKYGVFFSTYLPSVMEGQFQRYFQRS